MVKDNDNFDLVEVAMSILLAAGDARAKAKEALDKTLEGKVEEADKALEESKAKIVVAHRSQTDVIGAYADDEELNLNLLFIHAQDTLMTIKSEIFIIENMIAMYRNLKG